MRMLKILDYICTLQPFTQVPGTADSYHSEDPTSWADNHLWGSTYFIHNPGFSSHLSVNYSGTPAWACKSVTSLE